MAFKNTITVTLSQLAKMIDHCLLHPTMTDAEILEGLKIAREHDVATACIKPYAIPLAKRELAGTDVLRNQGRQNRLMDQVLPFYRPV